MRALRAVLVVVALGLVPGALSAQPADAPAPAAPVITPLPGGAVVDWSAGTIAASGAAAADLRAPNIEVARVTAERVAGERARAALAKAIRSLPLATGGTAGAKLEADARAAARLDAALVHARSLDVSYAADGGARVLLGLPLEAVRLALAPPEPPAADPAAPTAVVIDARKLSALRPGLGLRVVPAGGGTPVALPAVWVASKEAADADVRAGARRADALAVSADRGTVTLALDGKVLESAARAGALIVVVVGEGARK